MTENKLSSDIISLLEEACHGTIDNYEVTVHGDDSGGQGYLGEMVWDI